MPEADTQSTSPQTSDETSQRAAGDETLPDTEKQLNTPPLVDISENNTPLSDFVAKYDDKGYLIIEGKTAEGLTYKAYPPRILDTNQDQAMQRRSSIIASKGFVQPTILTSDSLVTSDNLMGDHIQLELIGKIGGHDAVFRIPGTYQLWITLEDSDKV